MRINKNTVGYIAILAMLLTASLFSSRFFLREKTSHDRVDIGKFPRSIGDWEGRDLEITERDYDILETRNLISREYTNRAGERIYLFIIYSETNRSVFHPPEVCMTGSGLSITQKSPEPVKSGRYEFRTNKLRAEKGEFKELVLYSYKAGHLYTDNFYLQQFYLAANQLFGKRAAGATVRVSMPLKKDEKVTLAALKNFLVTAAAAIDDLIRHAK